MFWFHKMSVHFSDLARKFFEHFFEMATKVETIEPFYADNVKTVFDFSKNGGECLEFNNKTDALNEMKNILPLKSASQHSFAPQPLSNGKVIILVQGYNISGDEKRTYEITFVLAETDALTHRYGITNQILIQL